MNYRTKQSSKGTQFLKINTWTGFFLCTRNIHSRLWNLWKSLLPLAWGRKQKFLTTNKVKHKPQWVLASDRIRIWFSEADADRWQPLGTSIQSWKGQETHLWSSPSVNKVGVPTDCGNSTDCSLVGSLCWLWAGWPYHYGWNMKEALLTVSRTAEVSRTSGSSSKIKNVRKNTWQRGLPLKYEGTVQRPGWIASPGTKRHSWPTHSIGRGGSIITNPVSLEGRRQRTWPKGRKGRLRPFPKLSGAEQK